MSEFVRKSFTRATNSLTARDIDGEPIGAKGTGGCASVPDSVDISARGDLVASLNAPARHV